jgi:glycerol-3-phosphate acyltransferase PlsY
MGLGDGTVALVGLAAFLGHLYPVFFKFEGRQGRGHGAGRAVRHQTWLGLATGADLADHCVLFPLFVAGLAGGAAFAPVYYLFGDRMAWYADKSITLACS